MLGTETAVLRRTWPQRLVILACVGVIGAALASAWFVRSLYVGVADIGRIQFSGDLLLTETDPAEPVNFLIIGVDSALGLDPDDPVTIGRVYDPRGTHNADSIALLRIDPVGGQAWVMPIPRDLRVDVPGTRSYKINATSLIGGAPLLVETINETFGIQINHYVQLDFLAFRSVVDQLDGVPMWFPFPARDPETGLNVPVDGCTVMDGTQALAFVRSRKYEEFRDDQWVRVGAGTDTARIERQQEFVIAALDRAIARGARNPTALSALINAAAESVVLDQGLTPAELIQLGEAFTDFDTDSLVRFSPATREVDDERLGSVLELTEPLDSQMFQVFRGVADSISLADIRFVVAGTDEEIVVRDTELFRTLGFSVGNERIVAAVDAPNVIVHPPGLRAEAEVLARYVVPVPAIVESSDAVEMTLVLGSDHDGVSFFFPQEVAAVEAAVAAQSTVSLPGLVDAAASPTSTTADPSTSTSTVPATSSTTTTTTTTAAPTTTTTTTTAAPTTTAALLPGRPPDGVSCDG